MMKPDEVAELLRVSVDTVYRMIASRIIPCYRVARTVRFERHEVDAFLTRIRRPTRDESEIDGIYLKDHRARRFREAARTLR